MFIRPVTIMAFVLGTLSASAAFAENDQIRIVGSSTVFPFATTVAERFGKNTSFKTPVVESTGSGGGLKLFCSGGDASPDITNASRRIKASEIENCAANGIDEVVEVKIGYDGIVLAHSKESAPFDLTLEEVFLALAKDIPTDEEGKTQPNPYTMWNEINPEFPAVKIEVLGPPPTSGTRDAFIELAMEAGCEAKAWVKELESDAMKALCHTMREDGGFVEAGENDNLIVQKLQANPNALGIFGYSFLEQNSDVVMGSMIDGVAPEFEAIADGDYPISRSLYFYVNKSRVGKTAGLEEFLAEFTSEDAMGEDGYLGEKGLIPLSEEEAEEVQSNVGNLTPVAL